MQKMTLVGRPALGHKLHEPVHTPSRQEVLHPTLLGQQGKHGAFPQQAALLREPRAVKQTQVRFSKALSVPKIQKRG